MDSETDIDSGDGSLLRNETIDTGNLDIPGASSGLRSQSARDLSLACDDSIAVAIRVRKSNLDVFNWQIRPINGQIIAREALASNFTS